MDMSCGERAEFKASSNLPVLATQSGRKPEPSLRVQYRCRPLCRKLRIIQQV